MTRPEDLFIVNMVRVLDGFCTRPDVQILFCVAIMRYLVAVQLVSIPCFREFSERFQNCELCYSLHFCLNIMYGIRESFSGVHYVNVSVLIRFSKKTGIFILIIINSP